MTTTVKVEAHCSTSVQVRIQEIDGDRGPVETVIQDGETYENHVYDNKEIIIKEEQKD